jgi:predicted nucleotidyltransferase
MLRESSLSFIRTVAEEYEATRVLLFGSCLEKSEEDVRDIDLAVEGLSRGVYFDFCGRLLWADELGGKTVDVVRVEDNGFLIPIILDEGIEIYAERESPEVALDRL